MSVTESLSDIKRRITLEEYVEGTGRQARQIGRELYYPCRLHADGKRGNLQVNRDKQEWHCKVCNLGGDIIELVGRELHGDSWSNRSHTQIQAVTEALGIKREPIPFRAAKPPQKPAKPPEMREVAVYPYYDAEGALVFEKVRFEYTDEDGNPAKTFRLRRKVAGRDIYNLDGIDDKPPFQLPDLLAADPFEPVHVTAGEKDALRLKALGYTAICSHESETRWNSNLNRWLHDYDVVLWQDNDEAGRKYVAAGHAELDPVAASVKIMTPADLSGLDRIDKGDVSDWLDAGHTPEELAAAIAAKPAEPSRILAGWLTVDQLATLPDIKPLIKGVLFKDSLAMLYSPTGQGKSFVTLDWSLSIASGLDWNGYETTPGMVAYIAAEGAKGMKLRVPAWINRRGVSPGEYIRFLPRPVEMLSPENVEYLITQLLAMPEPPSLVVIDTFSWCFDGEENSNSDMARYVKAIAHIRDATGACVLTIHHTGKNGDAERGGSALKANIDTAVKLSTKNGNITLTCDKQKDGAAAFADITMRLVPTEDDLTCTVEPLMVANCPTNVQKLRDSELAVLQALALPEHENGCTTAGLLKTTNCPRSTGMAALETLVNRGLVAKVARGEYLITAAGLEMSNNVQ